jgi:redox-sensitive bicupin YhaK (pirin superfamily)
MFPLLERRSANPLEMLQIWLNLPKANKMVEPHFKMLWSERIPKKVVTDAQGRETKITVIAGLLNDMTALAPPPGSWAAQASSGVAIWTIELSAGAKWTIPPAPAGVNRALYFHVGERMTIADRDVQENNRIVVQAEQAISLKNGAKASELLLLQGRPIGEPVARSGPFVMNTDDEIQQAYADYRATQFGGWPWGDSDPIHGSEDARFARFPNGITERPT